MKLKNDINVGKLVKGGMKKTGNPSVYVKAAIKGKAKASPLSIVKKISGKSIK